MIEITVDLETTANGGVDGRSPEAHYPQNRVLLWGYITGQLPAVTSDHHSRLEATLSNLEGTDVTIIGHNLKFDLKYMIREMPNIPWHKFNYYCTMYGEYRMSGHATKFIGLEEACYNRGIPFTKGLDLGAIIASGLKMEDIPRNDLEPYLEGDLRATQSLYSRQRQEDRYLYCPHVLPLAHMELLGLPLDVEKTKGIMSDYAKKEWSLSGDLLQTYGYHLRWSDGKPLLPGDIKINAPRTISYLLTGEPKTGIEVSKSVKNPRHVELIGGPLLDPKTIASIWGGVTPSHLGYPVGEPILKQLKAGSKYVQNILAYRKVQKIMGTYLGPFLEEATIQPTIHPKMHMVSTNTGRLSSAKPNGQNLAPVARECFKSEFGQFHEIDFKQLEVVALAAVSGCASLIRDVSNGEDIHYNTGRVVFNWANKSQMSEKDRKLVKAVNFGLIYGGGPKGLSESTGLDQTTVKKLIKAFYLRYPGVATWQNNFYTEVTDNMYPGGILDGEQYYESNVTIPISDRKFHFKETLSPVWLQKKTGRRYSFKPTETKNYPIQGFAGGDIVMAALSDLYERLSSRTTTEIRMTVHDSILVDTSMDSRTLNSIMGSVCIHVEQLFNLPFKLEFDIQSGQYWQ
jgi:DNA polymerase I-like protein with 3'-5' exonuclease and polymerase domains